VSLANQLDFDGDGDGDACDVDIDGDGVLNGTDVCAFTPTGMTVDANTGCSIAQLCPCSGPRGTTQPWRRAGPLVPAGAVYCRRRGTTSCRSATSV
jgi:hypothetical protein